mgnify:CR=1 FL=1
MAEANGLVEAMKRAARDERESSKPVNVYFGEVISRTPLKINVEQKMVLGESQLVLARNVTDYMTMVTVQWTTEAGALLSDGQTVASPAHVHEIGGARSMMVHNGLEIGDQVILIRQQGGQKFIVADRIGGR